MSIPLRQTLPISRLPPTSIFHRPTIPLDGVESPVRKSRRFCCRCKTMGKLWLLMFAAAAGFVAAVAASPDDAERRAYDRGFAAATKAVRDEAVRFGYATWGADDSGQASHFQWAPRSSRWRGGHDLSSHHSDGESVKSADRHKRNAVRPDKESDSEAG